MNELVAPGGNRPEPTAIRLDDATDAARCGRKAATLAELRRAGHNVPDGVVIPAGIPCTRDALATALAELGAGPWAVRSSGLAEDLHHASFAGQYESVIGVDSLDEVAAAAARVVASGKAARAATYRARLAEPARGLGAEPRSYRGVSPHGTSPGFTPGLEPDEAPLAVLVQRLVAADAAGVLFTRNPVTGDDERVLEAVRGLGDKLMDGSAEAERWLQRGGEQEAPATPSVLDPATAARLFELGARIERERGEPQDIEWALAAGEIFVLQARPITGLPRRPHVEIPPGRWMKDTGHFTGPVTPAAATILLPAYEAAFEVMFADFGLPVKTVRQRSFGGEVYTQDVDLSGQHDASAPPPWWLLALLVRLVPPLRRRMADAERGIARLDEYPRRWENEWRSACAARVAAARAVDLRCLSDDELIRHLDLLCDEVLRPHLVIHFQLAVPHVVGLFELKECMRELLGWDMARTMSLLTGLSTTTTAATRELEAVARELEPDVLAAGLEAVLASRAGGKFRHWLEHWGLRTVDVDPGTPMLAEREDLVLSLLAQAHQAREGASTNERAERRAALDEARRALSGADRARFEAALLYAERTYALRDDNVVYTEGLPNGLIRRACLEIGRRLVERRVLRVATDIGYLERQELAAALAGPLAGESGAQRVSRRRAEEAWVRTHPGPLIHGPAPVPDPDIRGLPAAARRLMRAALWAMAEELAPPDGQRSRDGALCGVPASPGRYTGRVRVIRHEAELGRLQAGEVLVCPTTHSSWTVAFGHAGALVTDGGSILGHPSIIAREHGIPAVVGTVSATARLRDGQRVTVDGTTGRVELE